MYQITSSKRNSYTSILKSFLFYIKSNKTVSQINLSNKQADNIGGQGDQCTPTFLTFCTAKRKEARGRKKNKETKKKNKLLRS